MVPADAAVAAAGAAAGEWRPRRPDEILEAGAAGAAAAAAGLRVALDRTRRAAGALQGLYWFPAPGRADALEELTVLVHDVEGDACVVASAAADGEGLAGSQSRQHWVAAAVRYC